MRIKKIISIALLIMLPACGGLSRSCAYYKGNDKICIDGVQYIQFTSGVSVAYNQDGTIKKCGG